MQHSGYGSTTSFDDSLEGGRLAPSRRQLTPPPALTPLTSGSEFHHDQTGSDDSSEQAVGGTRGRLGALGFGPGASHKHGHRGYTSGNAHTTSSDQEFRSGQEFPSSAFYSKTGSSDDRAPPSMIQKNAPLPPAVAAGNSPGQPAFAAEFSGTFVVVFIVLCCSTTGNAAWNSTAIGSILAAMCYATATVSGAHLNPAVSLAFALLGAVRWRFVVAYWVAQAAAGICAGCLHRTLIGKAVLMKPPAPFEMTLPMLLEAIFTCFLCFVVLSCVIAKRNNPRDDRNQIFGLAIGSAFVAGGYATCEMAGMALNPAVALGKAFAGKNDYALSLCLLWTAYECVGGALATLLFRGVHHEDFRVPQEQLFFEDVDREQQQRNENRRFLLGKCLSEGFGTSILVLTTGLVQISESPAAPIATAAALMALMYSAGVGEGHFNPAVTLAAVIRHNCAPRWGLLYAVVQLTAGSVAGLIVAAYHRAGPNRFKSFILGPGAGYSLWTAGWLEFVFTLVLAYVFLACATTATPQAWKTRQNFYFGIAIGATVCAAGYAIGTVSGASLNPAVSVGIMSASMAHGGTLPTAARENVAFYCISEVCGGIFAAIAFRATHQSEFGAKHAPLYG